ncbi:serine/threonine-protein kinase 17A-like [Thrips palmi]|uniref:non-specific serine/threonine protein kinase n=1 Tax=Thrips palmi TaxID=161013 RepID=A0A6P8ZNJ6_THRPL|nr:serine/threonine-protein kinase 17A-like [Thrips palmi]
MAKFSFGAGISLNTNHDGLLSVSEEFLSSLIKNEPISNYYHVEQTPFARGKFAAVRKCTHRLTNVDYAAKFIRKRRRSMDQRQEILHEVAVLRLAERAQSAQSARIVRLHEVYETPQEIAIVLELAAGGELQRVVDLQDGLPEVEAVQVMRQILEGLIFLHDHNIAHLDLKPQNMLLTGNYPDCDIKLCDFGISRVIRSGIEVREILGTPDYVAPEVLSYEPISLATDIWSVGVLAYVLLSGYSPFAGDTKQETFCNISQCTLNFPDELFEGVSEAARDFIRTTLQTDPGCRLSARQCLEHPWLSFKTPFLIDSLTSTVLNSCIESGVFSKDVSEEREQGESQVDNSVSSMETSSSSCSVSPSPSPSPISSLSYSSSTYSRSHSTSTPAKNGVSCGRRSSHPLINACACPCPCPPAAASNGTTVAVSVASVASPVSVPGRHPHPAHPHQHQLATILTSSPVEITVDRGIIC